MSPSKNRNMKLRRLLTDEWIKKMWYIHTMGYYSALQKDRNPITCSNMDGPGRHYAK